MDHAIRPFSTNNSIDDDVELAQAACMDNVAFEALYRRYRDRVYAYLCTRMLTRDDAADLTQQVFLRVLDALPQYQPERGSFASWLFTIVRNIATDARRRQHSTVGWDFVPLILQMTTEMSLEEQVIQKDDLAQLGALIRALATDKRELLLLVMRFVARLTLRDIAAIVGKREDAVRKSLARTLRLLKEQYDDISQ